MQSLQEKASEWSGLAASDAFAIDETNIFNSLGGDIKPFVDLSTNFYNRSALHLSYSRLKTIFSFFLSILCSWETWVRVFDDEEEWFRSIFANSRKEDAIRNQYEFFVQRMGGPPVYSQRKGHPALIARHRPFPVTHQAADRWLFHMQQALHSTPTIDPDSKIKMMNFFRHTAFFLVAGNEMTRQGQSIPCKHA
ncbi:hypothetical protein HPP92_004814 [Vanilla planifolia]|uniref:Hemoglobin n=1 Tax=Vanilla planifolia TaxID=51239 RepID=A0A835RK76_VANPL|nr:hypothetical protein HPP92_004814 [Vanilla planifolia]